MNIPIPMDILIDLTDAGYGGNYGLGDGAGFGEGYGIIMGGYNGYGEGDYSNDRRVNRYGGAFDTTYNYYPDMTAIELIKLVFE